MRVAKPGWIALLDNAPKQLKNTRGHDGLAVHSDRVQDTQHVASCGGLVFKRSTPKPRFILRLEWTATFLGRCRAPCLHTGPAPKGAQNAPWRLIRRAFRHGMLKAPNRNPGGGWQDIFQTATECQTILRIGGESFRQHSSPDAVPKPGLCAPSRRLGLQTINPKTTRLVLRPERLSLGASRFLGPPEGCVDAGSQCGPHQGF